MKAVLILEDFDSSPQQVSEADAPARLTEADRLAAYDAGYKEGWDDANGAQTNERDRISVELARSLQDLSFTFYEARVQVTKSLEQLVSAMVAQVFPRLSTLALAEHILAVLTPLADETNTPTLSLLCASSDIETLTPLIGTKHGLPLILTPEPSLMSGQAKFVLGHETHEIDVTSLQNQIEKLVAETFATLEPQSQSQEFSDVG
jgi:flagellar biosynthesis/type III secretory pathway protein FliH